MAKVAGGTAQLPESDREAIATYVKGLFPIVGPEPPRK
jgi:hypothetical protein